MGLSQRIPRNAERAAKPDAHLAQDDLEPALFPVKSVVADSLTTHVILTDGSLWGWGDAACGGLGDGEEPDWTPKGCGWDFMAYDLMVFKPVRIVPTISNFSKIFANAAYDFYDYAMTDDGKVYSWGRNKTGTLGNGVIPGASDGNPGTASDIAANHARTAGTFRSRPR